MADKRAADRRRKIIDRLPPFEDILRGSVVHRVLRCGKPSCACATGDGHPATYLSVTHQGGRTEQISLPKALIPLVERQIAIYQAWWTAIEKISAINRDQVRREREKSASQSKRRRRSTPS